MNRKLKKLIISLMMVWMMALFCPLGQIASWAENTRVAFSDPSVMVGNEVTVTMKVTSGSSLGTADIMLAYDPNYLEFISGTNANGGAGAIKVLGAMEAADQKAFSFTLKFKALAAGNTQISVTSQEIYDMDSQILTLDKQGSSTVKVTSPATYSDDAALKSLKISPGVLEPEFSASVDSYTASVDGSATDLVVNAVASNAGAKVTLQGEKGLQAGENQVIVKVTAEDGQTVKNYAIKVTKAEGSETVPSGSGEEENSSAQFGPVTASIDGVEYSVAASFDEAALPEGFEAQSYTYKGSEVMAGKGLEKELLLLYLQDGEGKGGFYIYNEEGDSWSRFVQVEASSKAVVVLPLESGIAAPEGFEEQAIDIDGIRVTGWVAKTEAEPEYCLFYGMNWAGEKNFYRYDLAEKTLQRYFASGVSNDVYMERVNIYNDLARDYRTQFYILIAVSALAIVLLITVILLIWKGGGRNWPDRDEEKAYINGRKKKRGGDVYDGSEEEEESRVTRYTREEFDRGPQEEESAGSDDEDDFVIETSLEEMEQELNNQTDKMKKTAPDQTAGQTVKEKQADSSMEDEDFEFMDLDDR